MFIDEILNQFSGNNPRSYYSFEAFILKLLQHHLESQNKQIIISDKHDMIFDALVPNGFDTYQGNTYIEIKYDINKGFSSSFLEKMLYRLNEYKPNEEINNLIIISATEILKRRKYFFEEKIKDYPINLIIWGPKEINSIAFKYKKITNNLIDNIFSIRLESTFNKNTNDWKKERDNRIIELKQKYKNGQFSLLLGAGVSSSAGMPDWNTLLNSLFVAYLTTEFNNNNNITDNDITDIVDRLNIIDDSSALIAARYLRKGLSKSNDEKDFTRMITKSLYKLRNQKYPIDSNLLQSIASLCTPKQTGSKVKNVITYNFDDLLERQFGIVNFSAVPKYLKLFYAAS